MKLYAVITHVVNTSSAIPSLHSKYILKVVVNFLEVISFFMDDGRLPSKHCINTNGEMRCTRMASPLPPECLCVRVRVSAALVPLGVWNRWM